MSKSSVRRSYGKKLTQRRGCVCTRIKWEDGVPGLGREEVIQWAFECVMRREVGR